jgi:hypothetical protein
VIGRLKRIYWDFLTTLPKAIGAAVWKSAPGTVTRGSDAVILQRWEQKAARSANPLLRSGAKFYSQSDEDGILLEILSRIGISTGRFLEIGVGNGLENNTIILLMHGWRGVWVGAEELAFSTDGGTHLRFLKQFVEPGKVGDLVRRLFSADDVPLSAVDVISVDIDSCDRPVVEQLLKAGCQPKVLIVEYNAKFPPPVRFWVDNAGRWDHTDYFGCSLQAWWDLLVPAGYRLLACNIIGTNAFFVQEKFAHRFQDVPTDIKLLFMPAEYNWIVKSGHRTSPKTLAKFI